MANISKRNRKLEKENYDAQKNRREIIAAQLSRREMMKMGLLTSAGMLVATKGLSARARNSAGHFISGGGGGGVLPNTPPSPPTSAFTQPFTRMTVKQAVAALNPAPTIAPNNAAGEGRTISHQAFTQFPPQKFYEITQAQGSILVHPDLPLQPMWCFDGMVPGPLYIARYGGDLTPPTAPASLTATANLATKTIELSWTASTDDVGVTGYRVFRDNGATPISTVTGTTFNDPNQLGTHVYVVAAIDAAGNQSAFSNSATATITIPEGSTLANLTVDPTTVTAPAPSTGTVTLNGAAPAGGVSVTLRSSDTGKATVPPVMIVPEGATSATFVITTLTGRLGGGKNPVTITATLGSSSVSATLTILRP